MFESGLHVLVVECLFGLARLRPRVARLAAQVVMEDVRDELFWRLPAEAQQRLKDEFAAMDTDGGGRGGAGRGGAGGWVGGWGGVGGVGWLREEDNCVGLNVAVLYFHSNRF